MSFCINRSAKRNHTQPTQATLQIAVNKPPNLWSALDFTGHARRSRRCAKMAVCCNTARMGGHASTTLKHRACPASHGHVTHSAAACACAACYSQARTGQVTHAAGARAYAACWCLWFLRLACAGTCLQRHFVLPCHCPGQIKICSQPSILAQSLCPETEAWNTLREPREPPLTGPRSNHRQALLPALTAQAQQPKASTLPSPCHVS